MSRGLVNMLRSGLVKKFLNRLRLSPQTSSEAGLTLIECLVAIIIIGLTVSAVTPALIISVASRVQSQKAAQALEVAQAEIDQVRTLVERGGNDYTLARLNASAPFVATAGAITYSTAAQVPVPTDAAVDSTAYYIAKDPTITKKVDQDGDGNADYAAQIFELLQRPPTQPPLPWECASTTLLLPRTLIASAMIQQGQLV
ncbi:MAG: type II secretion system protein [Leptolyngbyaceae cyanobacterium RM1_1_2]|nr:type II secretion system protein [Leptolyngbyaceae cyanobacterium RM1_1_2]